MKNKILLKFKDFYATEKEERREKKNEAKKCLISQNNKKQCSLNATSNVGTMQYNIPVNL